MSSTLSGYNAVVSDWVSLQQELKSISTIEHRQLEIIAEQEAMFAMGDDAIFWRCVSNAL